MTTISNFVTFDSTSNNVVRYTVDVRAATIDGFGTWYDEAATIATNVSITFVKKGDIVGYAEYQN